MPEGYGSRVCVYLSVCYQARLAATYVPRLQVLYVYQVYSYTVQNKLCFSAKLGRGL